MTALYNQFLADPGATRNWLATLWPYNPAAVQPDLLGDGFTTFGAVTLAMPAGSMTIGCWVRPRTSLSSLRYLANVQNGTAAGQRAIYFAGSAANDLSFAVRNDAGTQFSIDSSSGYPGGVPAGTWAYVAAVLDATNHKILLYINGALINSTTVSGTFNTALSNFTLMRAADASSGFFDGELSELTIYSIAQTPVVGPSNPLYPVYWNNGFPQLQVGSLVTVTNDPFGTVYAYYRLKDGGSSTTAVDSSTFNRTAITLTNPIWGTGDFGAVLPIYLSSGGLGAHGFNTSATDTPANMCYQPKIAIPPLMQRAMYSGSTIGGPSTPDYGQLDLSNADGTFDFLRTYASDGRRILIQYGGQLSANQGGTILSIGDYATVFDGVGSGDALIDEQVCSIVLKSKDWTFSKPLQTNFYTAQAPMNNVSTDKWRVPSFPTQSGSLTVEGWFYVSDAITAGQRFIGTDDGTHGWEIGMGAAGVARFLTRDLSATTLDSSAGALVVGWNHIAGVYDRSAQTKAIYVNGIIVGSVGSLTGSLAASSGPLTMFAANAGTSMTIGSKISEIRIWNVARSAGLVLQNFRLRMAGTETGLVGYWGLRDGGISRTAVDSSSAGNTAFAFGSITWDVADWVDPGVAGKTIPLTYGEPAEAVPANPDPYNLAYQVHDRAVLKIQAVYDKGLALAAPMSYTGTDVAFSAPNQISAGGADFSSLVVGQQITVTGSSQAGNNATWTVAAVSVNGQIITVAGSSIVTSGAGASVTVAATSPQYLVDLARGLIFLLTNPAGKITAWVRGDNPAGSLPTGGYPNTGADIIRRIITRHGGLADPGDLNTSSFASYKSAAPGVAGIYIFGSAAQDDRGVMTGASTGGARTLLDVITEVAGSNLGFFGFMRQANQFQLGQFQGVQGSPVTTITEFATATNVGVLLATPPHQTIALSLPIWQVIVGYAQNYGVLSAGELADDVQLNPARWNFCTKQWRFAYASDPSVLSTYSQARTLVIYTNLLNYADALAEAKRQLALFKVRRDLYRITASAATLYSLDVNQVITYTRALPAPNGRFGLASGRNFCILAFDEHSNNGGAASGSGTLGSLGNPSIITADIWA